MGPDFQTVQNNSHDLIVVSPQMFFWIGTYVTLALDVVAGVSLFKLLPKVSSARFIIPCGFITVILVLLFVLGCTNTLAINWDAGRATVTNRFPLGFSTTHTYATSDIDHAFVDADRMGPRVALRLRNGGAVLPLGTISMFKPSQIAVVEAINGGLRGRGKAEPGGASESVQSFHMSSSVDKALRQEHDFEQRLQEKKEQEQKPQQENR